MSTSHDRRVPHANGNGASGAAPVTLPEIFEAQAAAEENAPVLVHGGTTWSYADVDEQANRIAWSLIGRGIGPDDVVGVALPRCAAQFVTLLGILKAGAAYLPIDVRLPADRLTYVLADAAPRLILTDDATRGALPATATEIITVAAPGAPLNGHHPAGSPTDADRVRPLRVENLAYLIYTSGSTGLPKAVGVTHTGMAALAATIVERYAEKGRARVLQLAPLNFDVAVWEMLTVFATGGTLVVPPDAQLVGAALEHTLVAEEITHVTLPVSVLATLPAGAEDRCSALHTMNIGGESCPPDLIRRWSTEVRLINGYGATECSVATTLTPPLLPEIDGPAPIGHPIQDTVVHILDERLRPVPVGAPGELYVAGPGVARGYHEQFALTAERFVADPFGGPGTRMYRTGDLGRWTDDGQVVFLGRSDDQAKVRGFRVEPGEAEAALAALPGVAQAAVVVRPGASGQDHELIGYAVPVGGATLDSAGIRADLRTSLPDYLVPSAVVVLDAMPLTRNGKIDRAALPEPRRTGTGRAPRDAREETLCALLGEVLGVERVGIDDDFFDLGGHSLLATRLISRVRAVFGAELDLRTVFDTPTVAGLARAVGDQQPARPPLTRYPRPDVVPLSHAQRRMWFLHQMEGPSPAYNTPLALRMRGELDVAALEGALNDVIGRHEPLRTVFPVRGGEPYQLILTPEQGRIRLRVRTCAPDRVDDELRAAATYVFDLATEAPVRADLLDLGAEGWILVLVLHHIAGDGWSMRPLASDVVAAYAARCAGESVS
ncbi:amino acid adenylation domain-containing protein, partial [Actinoplanes missouriensis]|uniref:amino acid adenylation domain-containing protein n=1 Tax=Actinoplanes missouriensis TaxID=1866 RepID=UPI003401DEC3